MSRDRPIPPQPPPPWVPESDVIRRLQTEVKRLTDEIARWKDATDCKDPETACAKYDRLDYLVDARDALASKVEALRGALREEECLRMSHEGRIERLASAFAEARRLLRAGREFVGESETDEMPAALDWLMASHGFLESTTALAAAPQEPQAAPAGCPVCGDTSGRTHEHEIVEAAPVDPKEEP